ncbi:MAG: GNAT family N-acetyltransferase [Candidatus Kapaibacterium sp.]
MAFKELVKTTERLVLRSLDPSEAPKVLNYYSANREHFRYAMPELPANFYTADYHYEKLWADMELTSRKKLIRLYVFKKEDEKYDHIIGDVSVYNIILGAVLSGHLGFKCDKYHTGEGYTSESCREVLNYVFTSLELHRVEANVLEDNHASIHLIEKLGFRKEGITRDHAKISGRWRDHLRYSLLCDEWQGYNL